MQFRWVLPGRASAVQPSSSTSGDALLSPPFPPDPPDQTSPLSLHLFPPLTSTPPPSHSEIRRSHLSNSPIDIVMSPALGSPPSAAIAGTTTQFGSLAEIDSLLTVPATGNPNPLSSSSPTTGSQTPHPNLHCSLAEPNSNNLKTIQPNLSPPLLSNHASSSYALSNQQSPSPPINTFTSNSQPKTSISLPLHLIKPLPTSPSAFKTPSFAPSLANNPLHATAESPSDKPTKPSLKRICSSPTLSPPALPKISYQSSKHPPSVPFPEVSTIQYLKNPPFRAPPPPPPLHKKPFFATT
ncbi:unnamed protein product [Brassica rapa subsp. narinosa]